MCWDIRPFPSELPGDQGDASREPQVERKRQNAPESHDGWHASHHQPGQIVGRQGTSPVFVPRHGLHQFTDAVGDLRRSNVEAAVADRHEGDHAPDGGDGQGRHGGQQPAGPKATLASKNVNGKPAEQQRWKSRGDKEDDAQAGLHQSADDGADGGGAKRGREPIAHSGDHQGHWRKNAQPHAQHHALRRKHEEHAGRQASHKGYENAMRHSPSCPAEKRLERIDRPTKPPRTIPCGRRNPSPADRRGAVQVLT